MNNPAGQSAIESAQPFLTPYLALLDEQGYAVVPPEVTGATWGSSR